MLFSVALIILLSLLLSQLFEKFKLPGLMGMMLAGIVLGPFVFNMISPSILDVASELRQIALIVILLRAGLSLDLDDLKKVGRPALLIAFIPALFELLAIAIFAPLLFDISSLDALILGAVVAAVSPAIIVPRMIKLMNEGYGKNHSVPQLIMAGASIDDIFVIVLFAAFIQMSLGNGFEITGLLNVPLSLLTGALAGITIGLLSVWFFKTMHLRDTIKVLIMFALSFLMVTLENALSGVLAVSGLIAVITYGLTVLKKYPVLAHRLVNKFGKLWVPAEMMLFVLVGAAINIHLLSSVGFFAILLIAIGLSFRVLGVIISLIRSKLNFKERVFVSFSYTPKATVQAAIGAIPLSLGIASGQLILIVAALAILMTAPLGALLIDFSYQKCLDQTKE